MRGKLWCATALCLLLSSAWPMLAQGVSASDDPELGISAEAYILVEATTGRVLAGRETEKQLPIASTTKILTALIALEQSDINTYFTVDPTAIRVEGSSMGLQEGDQANLYSLAAGMLLASGNDAANAAAVRIAGSLEAFSGQMNRRAVEIGMEQSHFVTPSGLHDEEHYSTAADMALLGRTALQNKLFAELCRQSSMKLSYGNPPFDRWLKNHNKLLTTLPGCIGIKTGFTQKAGRTLVSAAERNGVTLVCVTLDASNDWEDHAKLYEYGFGQVTLEPIPVDTSAFHLRVVGGVGDTAAVRPLGETLACVTAEQLPRVTVKVYLEPFCYAPLREGEAVGEMVHYYDGFEVARTVLVAAESIELDAAPPKSHLWENIRDFFKEYFRI